MKIARLYQLAITLARARHCFQKYFTCIHSNSSHHWKIGIIIIPVLWVKKRIKVAVCAILQIVLAPRNVGTVCSRSAYNCLPVGWDGHWLKPGPSPNILSHPLLFLALYDPALEVRPPDTRIPSLPPFAETQSPGPLSVSLGLLLNHLSGCQRAGWPVRFSGQLTELGRLGNGFSCEQNLNEGFGPSYSGCLWPGGSALAVGEESKYCRFRA